MLVFINYWIEKCTVKHWNSCMIVVYKIRVSKISIWQPPLCSTFNPRILISPRVWMCLRSACLFPTWQMAGDGMLQWTAGKAHTPIPRNIQQHITPNCLSVPYYPGPKIKANTNFFKTFTLNETGFDSREGQQVIFFSETSIQVVGPTQPPIRRFTGGSFPVRTATGACSWPVTSTMVKNEHSYTTTP